MASCEEEFEMNLPNLLTMIRFVLIPIYLIVFFSQYPEPGRMYWALGVVLFAGLTDVIDGYVARRTRQITPLGMMLDPLADKLMMIAVFLSLLISDKINFWVAGAIFLRDVSMIFFAAIFHFRGKKTVPANGMGKLTTLLLYISLCLLMFRSPIAETFLWSAIIFSYLTSFIYLWQIREVNQRMVSS
jgi:cardiolipin synthase (CMP-forming)